MVRSTAMKLPTMLGTMNPSEDINHPRLGPGDDSLKGQPPVPVSPNVDVTT